MVVVNDSQKRICIHEGAAILIEYQKMVKGFQKILA
jgi:hypothetical protein